jgi:hypothetical protein
VTYPEPDPNPGPDLVETAHAGSTPAFVEDERRADRRWERARRVAVSCTIVNVVCGLFATVLVAHIIMVMGGANPGNGIASLVRTWSAGVSLGFDGLFTPSRATTGVVINYGLAAVAWLGIGAVTTTLIRRLALPGPARLARPRF